MGLVSGFGFVILGEEVLEVMDFGGFWPAILFRRISAFSGGNIWGISVWGLLNGLVGGRGGKSGCSFGLAEVDAIATTSSSEEEAALLTGEFGLVWLSSSFSSFFSLLSFVFWKVSVAPLQRHHS